MLKAGLIGNPSDPRMQDVIRYSGFEVTGVHDPGGYLHGINDRGVPEYVSEHKLIEKNDVLIFRNAFPAIMRLITEALKRSRHLLLLETDELPAQDIACLLKLSEESQTVIHARKAACANPALEACLPMIMHPLLMEIRMMVPENKSVNNGQDIDRDLLKITDVILSICRSNVKKINALRQPGGVKSLGFMSARVEFDNGSVASLLHSTLTASRRFEVDIYQKNKLLKTDLQHNKLEISEKNEPGAKLHNRTIKFKSMDNKYLTGDLDKFCHSVINRSTAGKDLFEIYKRAELSASIRQKAGFEN